MSQIINELCIKRKKLEMQLERNEEKGGCTITLDKDECEELFDLMKKVEDQLNSFIENN